MDNGNSSVSSKDRDQFPKGLRVLVVDDDVTCLCLLEKMLQDCFYRVTKCERGEDALSMIRENKVGFDIILTDVHMPGMDGLQLLAEIANMGMTLPVVLFSSDAAKDTVAKGVNGGACDFLVKPIRMSTLKILWQHVIRSNQSSSNDCTKELETPHAENGEEDSKSPKRSSGAKKCRVVWTPELNQIFITAVNSLGNDGAKPSKILQIMRKMTGVPHLTRQNVSSHLQKYRTNSKKIGEALEHQSAHSSLINSAGFANQTHSTPPPSSLSRCGGIQNNAASAQYPSLAMCMAPRQQCTGCLMRMPDLVEFPRNNALQRYQMGLQSQPLPLLQQSYPPLQDYYRRQQLNESAQFPSTAPAPSVGFTSPPTNNTNPVLSRQSDNSHIMQTPQAPSCMQILDDTAAARHCLSSTTHPHPLHGQISTHDIQGLSSSTPHPASEQSLPVAPGAMGATASKSCSSNIVGVNGEFCCRNNHNPIDEDRQVYGNETMFADMLDTNFFEDLGIGEDIPYLNRYIQDNGVM